MRKWNEGFGALLGEIKARIQSGQTRALVAVNRELVRLYWDIGRIIQRRQKAEGWGAAVIPRLSRALHNELPELKGFSERNIKRMTLARGWSRDTLALQIQASAHARHGRGTSNFSTLLPPPQSDLTQQALKDPYIFDFLTLTDPFQERDLETQLVGHLEKFLIELGQGFAFLGRQYRLDVGHEDFYVDLLFYHVRLRAFIVIDLKKGAFKPEYAGKLNFCCSVVNDHMKHPSDGPTIGLILCQSRDRLLAEYSLSGIAQPIGISTYQLTRALPPGLRSALPTVEEIEAELSAPGTKAAVQILIVVLGHVRWPAFIVGQAGQAVNRLPSLGDRHVRTTGFVDNDDVDHRMVLHRRGHGALRFEDAVVVDEGHRGSGGFHGQIVRREIASGHRWKEWAFAMTAPRCACPARRSA